MQAPVCPSFDRIDRRELVDENGIRFDDFRRGLRPRYGVVWFELLLGHGALVLSAIATVLCQRLWPAGWPLWGLLWAMPIGVAVTYIVEFFHEAAHFNIARNRRLNDLLANLVIGALLGRDIRAYRRLHFDHHRYLGTPRDTERSYFDALDGRFFIESLTGLAAIKVLFIGEQSFREGDAPTRSQTIRGLLGLHLLWFLLIQGAVVVLSFRHGEWALLLAWLLGLGSVFPFLTALRQLLEHRSFSARSDVDYGAEAHGAVNRMFGNGLLARIFGGAGFNRHLLHHWEPQISYTQLGPLEAYLSRTSARALVVEQRTTYGDAFRLLFAGRS
jgi:fatty acid desaturase